MSVRELVPRAVAMTLAVAVATACGGDAPEAPAEASAPATGVTVAADDARASGIETATVRAVERSEGFDAGGRVTFDERRTARIGSLVQGVVHDLALQPGDAVARGAIVARLHSHVVHDAWAFYFKALAERRRTEAELAYARTAEARAVSLVAGKALSPQELERARADVTAATEAVVAAKAEITRAEQELHHYGITPSPDADPLSQEDVPVESPVGGTVIERLATEGSAVNPGSPLLVVSDLSRVWVLAEIDERLVGRVTADRPVTVRTPAHPDESFPGTLTSIGDVVNPATRRVTLRVELANPGRRLKPEMLVTVTIAATTPRRMLVVPTRSLQTMDGESVVFVRTEGDRFVRRAITAGATMDGEVEVVRGLQEGEVVATAGAFLLKSALTSPASGEP